MTYRVAKTTNNLFFLLLIGFSSFAQVKGIVNDSISGKPISYVNIWVENASIGTTSEENGEFALNTSADKILIFSSLGFKTKKIKASEASTVVLQQVAIHLDEVVVSKPKKTKEIEAGDLKKAFYLPEPQLKPSVSCRKIMLVENNHELKYLKNITYFTKSSVQSGIFRVRVFSVNKDGSPNEDLLHQEIIVKVKKGKHKTVVDVASYGIEIPQQGILVGFENLLTEENKYTQKGLLVNGKTMSFNNYSPHILYNYMDTEESYSYQSGMWTRQLFRWFNEHGKGNRVLAPAIKVTLTN